jgi:hypothetical protein
MKKLFLSLLIFAAFFIFPSLVLAQVPADVFGEINAPQGVEQLNTQANGIGVLLFISNMIKLATVIAGIIVFFNLIRAGYTYINSQGNSKANEEVKNIVTYSILGLILIVAAYTIMAVISVVLFGDAGYILNPTLVQPGAASAPNTTFVGGPDSDPARGN